MHRTIADELRDEGAVRMGQQTLIRQLTRRFGDLPDEVVATIYDHQSVLERFLPMAFEERHEDTKHISG